MKYGIESLALFGSFSRGEQNEESDVDVLISLRSPSLFIYAEIQATLESVLKRRVDLVSSKARKREFAIIRNLLQICIKFLMAMNAYVQRERYLQKLIDRKENGEIKIVTGPRRCGKSFLLKTIYRE